MPTYEFHISRKARKRYQFDEQLFALDGNVILADFAAARRFAERMTRVLGQPVPASDVNAMGLIDEILHLLIRQYERQNPGVMHQALDHLHARLSEATVEATLLKFTEEYPPLVVHRGQVSPRAYLDQTSAGTSRRETTLEEVLLLYLANANPAFKPYRELFDDEELRRTTAYETMISGLQTYFASLPAFEPGGETLIEILLTPARRSPHSLQAQLEYLLERWGEILGEALVQRILRSIDFVREEALRRTGPGGFGGETPVLTFAGAEFEYERFSQDKDWMPRLVLIAKNSYVWLDQLSKWYHRSITRLDQIPDEELDTMARRGITGLWLIGLWDRSRASQRIKQMMGNPDAVASAYSLMDYQIAGDLGGWEALSNLRGRAWQHGIRLSADMVPNHMGIDSHWVSDHPDWFLSLPYSPYPNYTFNGVDLSSDSRTGIYIEDHYYDRTDAAVVFKRTDHWTGDVRYIYHGNDGTSMPWNDTAQLDYSKAEVREAVIQTILQVARNFPIIRFDAAMTLAKKHIQRLWFPEPGAGGAIPSRSEHGLTRAQFDAAFPNEFWREVVDRVAAEVPDTLLLAEAFWLMEGYFVRTLGMHRVYNSAFMHMLRDEDNAKYRTVMKNVLEFDPQVLKRFVNFMNNPDEKTAIEQFGDGDKYFGVATLMASLPGLPMIGHGQIEGFHEKYGMEYRRAYWDEHPNEGLIARHEWQIFPLLRLRHLFADIENFLLYDVFTPAGKVNEDVFALSNGHDHERGLVVYHNKFAETSGWIKHSVAYMDKTSMQLIQRTLGEGLALHGGEHDYVLFRDISSGLEFVRSSRELVTQGLFVELKAYQCHAFVDFREVADPDGKFAAVCRALKGAGVQSVEDRLREMFAPAAVAVEVKPKAKIARRPAPQKPARRKKPQASSTRRKTPAMAVPEAKPKAKKARKPAPSKPVRRLGHPKKPKVTRPRGKTRAVAVSEVKPKVKKVRIPASPKPSRKAAHPKKPNVTSSRAKIQRPKKQKRK
ncbi:MAG: alpha-amylase family glycosyl hydrolase [Anaerolineales bacterium]|jgi:glycosidase